MPEPKCSNPPARRSETETEIHTYDYGANAGRTPVIFDLVAEQHACLMSPQSAPGRVNANDGRQRT